MTLKEAFQVCGYMCIGAAIALSVDVIVHDTSHWRVQIVVAVGFVGMSRLFYHWSKTD